MPYVNKERKPNVELAHIPIAEGSKSTAWKAISLPDTIVSLKLDFAAQKKGGMAVSAVWTLVCFARTLPSGTKEHANTHGRDAQYCHL